MVLFNTEKIVDGHNSALAWQKLRKFADKTGAHRVFPLGVVIHEIERRGPFPCSFASGPFQVFQKMVDRTKGESETNREELSRVVPESLWNFLPTVCF